VIGRFYSNDPIGFIGTVDSFNRYSYVGNNPYKYTDPTGMFAKYRLTKREGLTKKINTPVSDGKGGLKLYIKDSRGIGIVYKSLKLHEQKHIDDFYKNCENCEIVTGKLIDGKMVYPKEGQLLEIFRELEGALSEISATDEYLPYLRKQVGKRRNKKQKAEIEEHIALMEAYRQANSEKAERIRRKGRPKS